MVENIKVNCVIKENKSLYETYFKEYAILKNISLIEVIQVPERNIQTNDPQDFNLFHHQQEVKNEIIRHMGLRNSLENFHLSKAFSNSSTKLGLLMRQNLLPNLLMK